MTESNAPRGTTPIGIVEIIKTTILVLGFLVVLYELYGRERDYKAERLESSRLMLMKGADLYVIESLVKAVEHARNANLSESQKWHVLADATPVHEYLVTWAACVETNLCDSRSSLQTLCGRLIGYELVAKEILRKLGMPYDEAKRNKEYFGILTRCSNR